MFSKIKNFLINCVQLNYKRINEEIFVFTFFLCAYELNYHFRLLTYEFIIEEVKIFKKVIYHFFL